VSYERVVLRQRIPHLRKHIERRRDVPDGFSVYDAQPVVVEAAQPHAKPVPLLKLNFSANYMIRGSAASRICPKVGTFRSAAVCRGHSIDNSLVRGAMMAAGVLNPVCPPRPFLFL
jgi:hypothetical protein